MRKRILSLALTLAMLVAFVPFATPTTAVAASMFPYVLDGPYTNVDEWGWTFWNPPTAAIRQADIMVVEYEGARIDGYSFFLDSLFLIDGVGEYNNTSWDDSGKSYMTEEPGKIIFDLRGLEGGYVGFRVENASDAAKIKRVYLDGDRYIPPKANHQRLPRPAHDAVNPLQFSGPLPESKTYMAADAFLDGDPVILADGGVSANALEFTVEIEQDWLYRLDFECYNYGDTYPGTEIINRLNRRKLK